MVPRFLLLILSWLCVARAFAGVGDLTVTPTRIIFEGPDRSAQISLINRGNETATYRIAFVQMRMLENGQIEEITEPNELEKFSDNLVRFSPRQVTLEPNVGQTVRLLLRKPADLQQGEYRSHLLFYAVPTENVGMDVESLKRKDAKAFSVAIQPIFRVSIPVIVRHGDLKAEFTLADLTYHPEKQPYVSLRLNREGEGSVYGDLDIYFKPDGGGEPVLLRHITDFVLYTSGNTRTAEFPVYVPEGVALSGGSISAVYYNTQDGQRSILAETEIPIK